MNNKNWDLIHKTPTNKPHDKDMEKFIKRFYHADKTPKTVLDMACGQGHNTDYLSDTYKRWNVYACDFSAKGLLYANQRLLGRGNVLLRQCDVIDTKHKSDYFDLIVLIDLEHDNYIDIVKECHRILKPKGRFFIKSGSCYVHENTVFDKIENKGNIYTGRKI
jgi:SAM-dependent methyltransferase